MATYNGLIKKRNQANNGWDTFLPVTIAENVLIDGENNVKDEFNDVNENIGKNISLVSVRQFGALGNGDNQTQQFQATINSIQDGARQNIYVPKGSYIVDELNVGSREITWMVESGGNVTGNLKGCVVSPDRGVLYDFPSNGGWRVELRKTDAPLNYKAGTQAVMVVQNKDKKPLGLNEFSSGIQMDFVTDADGYVLPENRYSGSIWQGLQVTQDKKGDGSGHCYSALGQLKPTGAKGYNELGLFQGQATNVGSGNGTISGVEVIVSDGPNNELNYPTALSAVIGRVNRKNNNLLPSYAFVASSEGTRKCTAILATNKQGMKEWERGIDLSEGVFDFGRAVVLPQQGFITSTITNKEIKTILGVGNNDLTVLKYATDNGGLNIQNDSGTPILALDSDPNNPVALRVNGFISRVVVGEPNSGGEGYRMLRVAN